MKAVNVLKQSDIIFVPGSSADRSISKNIIRDLAERHGFSDTETVDLEFPMTRDREFNRMAWERNVSMIIGAVSSGKTVSYAVLGNPTLYSTFSIILEDVRKQGVEVVFVAGVSSLDACSSVAGMNLAKGDESIAIITYNDFMKRQRLDFDTVIIMKVPGGSPMIEEARRRFPEFRSCVYARRCTMPQQIIRDQPGEDQADYFSMIILRR